MTNSNQLVPIKEQEIGQSIQKSVSARKLHEFLESKQQFANWINNRIKQYGFIENEDYLISLLNRSDEKAGKPRKEYHVTLDMAKELSMVEKTKKGRQARRYFIDCEKALRQKVQSTSPKLKERSNHFTVQAYGKYQGIALTLDENFALQKECIRLSKLNQTPYYPYNDNPNASIFTFREDILGTIFSEIGDILETRAKEDHKKALEAERDFHQRANTVLAGTIEITRMIEENKKMYSFIVDRELHAEYSLFRRMNY